LCYTASCIVTPVGGRPVRRLREESEEEEEEKEEEEEEVEVEEEEVFSRTVHRTATYRV